MSILTGRRVLVVEDEYLIAMDLCQTLNKEGATVVGPAASLGDALDIVNALDALDAAVLDVNLSGNAVFPLADVLSERGVPYVFTTGYDRLAIPPRYQTVPICGKPVHMGAIVDAVSLQIRGRQPAPSVACAQATAPRRWH